MSAPSCSHCGLPVPPQARSEGPEQFCCSGCKAVWEIIHQSGLAAYYDIREEAPQSAAPLVAQSYEELDDPAFLDRAAPASEDGARHAELFLEGIHCSACMWLIERALTQESGVGEARLDFGRRRLRLSFDPETTQLSKVARRLAGMGYAPHPASADRNASEVKRDRTMLIRLAVAGASAGNVMLMAFALYGGWASGMAEEHRAFFRVMSVVAALPAIFYSAWPFYRGAWVGLLARNLHMDLPISLGILAGAVSGTVNAFSGSGEIYFDSVTALIFLLLVGRMLQTRQQRVASDSSEMLFALTPASATRVDAEGRRKTVALESIARGDRVWVDAHALVPTDGIIETGRTAMDLSLLSGESMPVSVGPGDAIYGGATNLDAPLVMTVSEPVRNSRVGKMAVMIEAASSARSPVVQLADRVAGWFVATVILLAGLAFAVWWQIAPEHALDHAVALLVVSCPCALGLATPLAITAAIGKAAKKGLLVRTGAALEALGKMKDGVIVFDKTGTLTYGRMERVRFVGDEDVLRLVAAAERGSSHPVGRALRAGFAGDLRPEGEVETVAGGGIAATVEGKSVVVGNRAFVEARASGVEALEATARTWAEEAVTPVWVAVDGVCRGLAGVADRVRPEAQACLQQLRELGFELRIASGDHPEVVAAVGESLGLASEACQGGLTPEDKLALVESLESHRPTVMVGDGVNDAAALARARVGIAVHGAAETSFRAADIFSRASGVSPLLDLVLGSRRTYRTIVRGIVFSLIYNLLGASLALFGLLGPLVAAVLMPISSLVVVTHAFAFPFGRPPGTEARASGAGEAEGRRVSFAQPDAR